MRVKNFIVALVALLAISAHGAWLDESAALRAAGSFLATATGQSVLPGSMVKSVEERGGLWVVSLTPSGHILVSRSDRATPIIGFSANDFDAGEENTPERAAIDAADEAVLAAEADETKTRHKRWDAVLAVKSMRSLKAIARDSSSSAAVNIEPFITSRYNQCQPWNDLTPVVSESADAYYRGRSLAGCVSVADAALVRAMRWPVYPARTDTVTHQFRGGMFDIRFDGSAPFDWDLMQDSYPVYGDLRGTLAEDRRYEIGRLLMWLNHSAGMTYSAGESTSTKYNAAHGGERDWYTIGRNMVPTADGVEEIVTKTLAAGIPVFVGVGGHAVVADGWKVENDESYVDLVYGWGGAGSWYSLESGTVRYFWVEHYPRAKPQLDPIPRVCGDTLTLSWHFPECHANNLNGFIVSGKRRSSAALTTWVADFSDASTGNASPADVWTTHDFGEGSLALDANDLTYGFYQFSTPLTITEDSVLSLNIRGGAYSSGDACQGNVVIEICGDDGNWRELFVPECNWSNWPGSWRANQCSLADYAGQTIQLRIYKRHTLYNGRIDIGNFQVSNVIPLTGGNITPTVALATVREVTLTGLDAGADYAFSVTPILADGALAVAESSDAKITTVAGTHAIPGTAVDVTADYNTEETSITFTDSFQITAGSTLSCKWYADCEKNGYVQMKVVFTPDEGDSTTLYTSGYKAKVGQNSMTGEYTEDIEIPASLVGVRGTLKAVVFPYFEIYGEAYAEWCDIGESAIKSITVGNVFSIGVPETETLTVLEQPMPEITSIQYQADGNAMCALTDGTLANGAIGTMTIKVGSSDAVTDLKAFPSHIELVDDSKVHVKRKSDGFWYITFDAAIPANRNRQRQILTLRATDSNGTIIHKDIVMRMTTDSGIDGGTASDDEDAYITIYKPNARPIAVWNGDFNGAYVRGAVTLNAQDNTIAADGSTITKIADKKGINFAISGDGTSVAVIAGISNFTLTGEKTATLATVSTSGKSEAAGIGISCQNDTLSRYRGLFNSNDRQWSTAGNNSPTYTSDKSFNSLAFTATSSRIDAWLNGETSPKYSSTDVKLDGNAVTGLALGGWNNSTNFGAIASTFSHVAIFAGDTMPDDNDRKNWNLADMTGTLTIPSSGGALTALETGRSIGVNLNGGDISLDERIYAAAIFVQDDTELNVSVGSRIASSRILYVAPGKKLTVNVSADATALTNIVKAAGGIYTSRILHGAIYGDIEAGSLPNLGDGYVVETYKEVDGGFYFKITDKNALNISNEDGSTVGYIDKAGNACVITNATGTIIIPDTVSYVYIVAKNDPLMLTKSANHSPSFTVYASDANGEIVTVSGIYPVPVPLTLPNILFSQRTSADGTKVTLSLNPEAEYSGVKVEPELYLDGDAPEISDQPSMTVKTIQGLWYAITTSTDLSDESFDIIEDTVRLAGSSSTALSSETKQTGDTRFYRVRVGASKAALQNGN